MKDKGIGTRKAGVVALTRDLMFAARIRGAAPEAVTVHAVDCLLEEIGPETRLVLIDLDVSDAAGAVASVRASGTGARIVAFAPHVETEAMASAGAAGADRVMVRGRFVRELPDLVKEV